MRVLVLHSELGVLRGGGENFTRNLFTAFAARGHQVAAAFVADLHGCYPIALPVGVEPIPICGWWSRKPGQGTLSTVGRLLESKAGIKKQWDRMQDAVCWRTIDLHNKRFRRRIEREFGNRWNHFDAVYVHGDAPVAVLAAMRRPTVLRLPGPVTAELEPQLRAIHAVCANGDALLQIQTFLGEHAIELPVGLDARLFRAGNSSIRSRLGWAGHERVIGYAGRLTHLKGIDLLAAAFRDVACKIANVKLLVIGTGEEQQNFRSALGRELLEGKVHIEPDVTHERLADWYRAMDLFVMPSRYENFSNALLEAMACGVPFLASDVGGNKILAATGAGWVFEPQSSSALSGSLETVLSNVDELRRRGTVGLTAVRNHYSWSATARRLEEIVHSILE